MAVQVRTRVVCLLQLQRVNDTERKPDALGLHLFAVEPVRLNGLVDVVVVWHGPGRHDRSSCVRLDLCGRGLQRDGRTS